MDSTLTYLRRSVGHLLRRGHDYFWLDAGPPGLVRAECVWAKGAQCAVAAVPLAQAMAQAGRRRSPLLKERPCDIGVPEGVAVGFGRRGAGGTAEASLAPLASCSSLLAAARRAHEALVDALLVTAHAARSALDGIFQPNL